MTDTSKKPEGSGKVSDAVPNSWVDVWAPILSRPYLRLSRADRPIGTWLLLLPCWWGVLLAASWQGSFGLGELWIMIACAIGAWLMRGAGCTWNDITDRKIDALVERTRSRPIPSGQISVQRASIWLVVQLFLSFLILITFQNLAIILGISSLLLVAAYPYAKRFTWWPQVFLGLTFNWGIFVTWAAVTGELHWPAFALYLAGIFWTMFYDTIYAHQDTEDDALIGVKSTARIFGYNTHKWLRWFMVISVVFMALAVVTVHSKDRNILALVVALGGPWAFGWHLAWQNKTLKIDMPEICLNLMRSNRNAGLFPALFFATSLFL